MLEQLEELLEMQRVLDDAIFKEHGITEYPVENMKLALFDELGELLHEFPTEYKHWKKTAVDNREKGLEEYVDCLHFALSMYNQNNYNFKPNYNKCFIEDDETLHDILCQIVKETNSNRGSAIIFYLFILGNYFGFTWEEIYEAYKKKNAVNYERLRNNY